MSVIFDLDGTLIDSSERMYRLFCTLIPECQLTKEEYWNFKRDKVNHRMLLERLYPEYNFDEFNKKWMSMIETRDYLIMDKNYEDTTCVLKNIKERTKLYLLTARQSKTLLLEELQWLGLLPFIDEVMVTEGVNTKEEILKLYCKTLYDLNNKNNIFISDMGSDIHLGNKMGYHTIAITHGFMNGERLAEYKPDQIIDELSEIKI